jgi:hypothetical protein
MEHLNSNHRFFSADNMLVIVTLIEEKAAGALHFEICENFCQQLIKAALDYPHYLITANAQEGIDQLNDVVVRRALMALTETDGAGQYVAGNALYAMSRKHRKSDMDELQEHKTQGAAVTLAGNIYRKRNERFQAEQIHLRNMSNNNTYQLKFSKAFPVATHDSIFWELQ